jgi:hypothetical protein
MSSPSIQGTDRESSLKVNRTEFNAVLAECALVTKTYLREAEKTSTLLVKCTQRPLSFDKRFALLTQEIQEKDAFQTYLGVKRVLHNAALVGYDPLASRKRLHQARTLAAALR